MGGHQGTLEGKARRLAAALGDNTLEVQTPAHRSRRCEIADDALGLHCAWPDCLQTIIKEHVARQLAHDADVLGLASPLSLADQPVST
jgi:hypothetical protein